MMEIALPQSALYFDDIDSRHYYYIQEVEHTVPVCFSLAPSLKDSGVSLFKLAGRYTPKANLTDLGLVKRTRKDGSTYLTYLYPKIETNELVIQLKQHAQMLWDEIEHNKVKVEVECKVEEGPSELVRFFSNSSSKSAHEKCAQVDCSSCKNPSYLSLSLLKNRTLPIPQCCGHQVAYIKRCGQCPRFFFQPFGTCTSLCHKCNQ